MVPDLMSIQADGKIPIDLMDNGLALKTQQKEEKEGGKSLMCRIYSQCVTGTDVLRWLYHWCFPSAVNGPTEGPCSVVQCYVVCQVDSLNSIYPLGRDMGCTSGSEILHSGVFHGLASEGRWGDVIF